jgi:protein-S-isoprenylcysteine O-methyltransferase Ste14
MDELAVGAIAISWSIVVAVWIWAGVRDAATRATSPAGRSVRGGFSAPLALLTWVVAAIVLLAGETLLAPISIRAPAIRLVGLGLLVASTAFALWARRSLGTSWSIGPRVTGDQRLRTTGPYAVTRHPIYTGLLGMVIGSALLAGGGRWLAPIGVVLVAVLAKVAAEEQLLLRVFPEEYPAYRETVPALVPGLGWLAGRLRAAARVRRA